MSAETDNAGESTISRGFFGLTGAIRKIVKWGVITLAAVGAFGSTDVGGALLFGWAQHIGKNLPPLLEKSPALILPLLCLAIATVTAHRFMAWLASGGSGGESRWKLPHSLVVIGLLLLGSAAAIAMSGITHQLAWLSKEPLRETRGMDRQLHEASRAVDRLLFALGAFRAEHDRFPDTMAELMASDPDLKGMDRVAPVAGHTSEPIIYLKPSWDSLSRDNQPVFVSPYLPKSRLVVVGYSNLKSEWKRADERGEFLGNLSGY